MSTNVPLHGANNVPSLDPGERAATAPLAAEEYVHDGCAASCIANCARPIISPCGDSLEETSPAITLSRGPGVSKIIRAQFLRYRMCLCGTPWKPSRCRRPRIISN